MKVCFINYPAEHYTTTRPGAIAIVIQGLTANWRSVAMMLW